MFGCIAAGRPVQANLLQVAVNKFASQILDAASVGHIVVFLLGTIPFEPGYGATVHFQWPGKEWQLLGMISQDKPSAIFRINAQKPTSGGGVTDMSMDDLSSIPEPVTATLGISIEPLPLIHSQMATLTTASPLSKSSSSTALIPVSTIGGYTIKDPTTVAVRVLENLYHFVTGFATSNVPQGAPILGPPQQIHPGAYVPVKVFMDWYNKFCAKVKADPGSIFKEN